MPMMSSGEWTADIRVEPSMVEDLLRLQEAVSLAGISMGEMARAVDSLHRASISRHSRNEARRYSSQPVPARPGIRAMCLSGDLP